MKVTAANITSGNITTTSGSAYNVAFDVVNAGSSFSVQVPTAGWDGILVAPDSTILIDGSWKGEVAGGGDGNTITLMSAITLNHPAGAAIYTSATPEPSTAFLLAGALAGIGLLRKGWPSYPLTRKQTVEPNGRFNVSNPLKPVNRGYGSVLD